MNWRAEFLTVLGTGGDSVDVAQMIRERALAQGDAIIAANQVREMFGLSVKQTLAMLNWVEGGLSDQELRQAVPGIRAVQ